MVGLIGANGAGKTTVLSTIAGVLRPARGTITFGGESIVGESPEDIVRKGIALVPEGRRIFPGLTVEENLRLGAATRSDRLGIQQGIDVAVASHRDEAHQLFRIVDQVSAEVAHWLKDHRHTVLTCVLCKMVKGFRSPRVLIRWRNAPFDGTRMPINGPTVRQRV